MNKKQTVESRRQKVESMNCTDRKQVAKVEKTTNEAQ